MSNNKSDTQDEFLKYVLKNKLDVRIFLVNGIKLEGNITHFDQYSLVLNNASMIEHNSILIYKHAISTISPKGEVELISE